MAFYACRDSDSTGVIYGFLRITPGLISWRVGACRVINGFLRIGPGVGERAGGGLLLAYSTARVSGLPIRRSDDAGADVAM
jgi:hypothetical protein